MKNSLTSKRALFSGLGLAAVIAVVVVLAQVVSYVPNLRLDLTEDNLYTLTDGTRHMLKGMEQPVKVELFFSAKMAEGVPQIGNYAQRVTDMLREYQRLAGGKVDLHVIDPEAFSADEDRAGELGLMSVPIVAGGPEIYFGLAATGANGKPEIIDFFRPDRADSLEYDLSQVLWKASRTTAPKIALYAGLEVMGGFDFASRQPSPPWAAFAQLEQLYSIEQLAPDFDHVADDVRLLVLVHPADLPEKSLRAIDRYALAGGAVLVFVDPVAERAGGGMMGGGSPLASNLAPLFAAWGVDYDPTQVLGDALLAVPVASSEFGRPAPHVGIQQFGQGDFPQDDPITARLERLHAASSGVLKARAGATST
ncbi:MAG: GldG family protein, partial [Actinomycetota bacterium]|nr:GldG family protein [Actinomycetota bacterium]